MIVAATSARLVQAGHRPVSDAELMRVFCVFVISSQYSSIKRADLWSTKPRRRSSPAPYLGDIIRRKRVDAILQYLALTQKVHLNDPFVEIREMIADFDKRVPPWDIGVPG